MHKFKILINHDNLYCSNFLFVIGSVKPKFKDKYHYDSFTWEMIYSRDIGFFFFFYLLF